MKVEEIEKLLVKFYEGTAIESEEKWLEDAFRTGEVPEHLQADRRIVLALRGSDTEAEDVPVGLADRLNRMIDAKAEEEQRFFRRNRAKRNWRWIGGIAATVLLLIGMAYGIANFGTKACPPTPQDTFTNPEDAYRALQATLIEMSANLNAGIEQMKETQQDMAHINQEIRNEIKR
ncbi:MAG: hypothetical protein Q4D56_02410 [Bacteroides sp.]|nr:hypothetical protein [Bacteroides sp.]